MSGRISDFSTVAGRYDDTRHVPERVLTEGYGLLMRRGVLPEAGWILDVGCGTGQISLPLADLGFEVVGVDVSEAMVRVASSKLKPHHRARYEVGDSRSLDHGDETFDGVVFSKLLMHIEDWTTCCDEMVRVSKKGSSIVHLVNSGVFGDSVRRDFARRIDDLGFRDRFLGAPSWSGEIARHMSSNGCEVTSIRDRGLTWKRPVTRRRSLDGFKERLFAEFWYIPLDVYDDVLSETSRWAETQPGGLDEPEILDGHLSIELFKTPA